MKPKDLKCPFRWDNRRPLLHEGVLYVPTYYDKHKVGAPDFLSVFQNDCPCLMEFCSGNGDWVVGKALQFPKWNWIAVEKRFDRVRKIWSKMKNHGVQNLLIVCGEAMTFSKEYLPPQVIDEIFVNFPDPWPKRGHAKHRLIQTSFAEECARVSKDNGSLMLVTDDPDYSQQMIEVMTNHSSWESSLQPPHFLTEWPGYGDSFFETLWRAKGLTIHYHQFKKNDPIRKL